MMAADSRFFADRVAAGRDPAAGLRSSAPCTTTTAENSQNAVLAFLQGQVEQQQARGGGCILEDALADACWQAPVVTQSASAEAWHDTPYSSCVFAGARCRSQRLRRNIDEIASGPALLCQHFHDPLEWDACWVGGEWRLPSQEEAQLTAPLAFFIAVSASWCATGGEHRSAGALASDCAAVGGHAQTTDWIYLLDPGSSCRNRSRSSFWI